MNREEYILSELVRLSSKLVDENIHFKDKREFFQTTGFRKVLVDEDLEAYQKVFKIFYKSWADNFSEIYIWQMFQSLFVGYAMNNDKAKLEKHFRKFEQDLNKWNETHKIFIPILGLELKLNKLEIGNITLLKTDEVKGIFSKISDSKWLCDCLGAINAKVCAEVKIPGETLKAQQKAVIEVRRHINLFKYTLSIWGYDPLKYNIAVEGDNFFSTHTYLSISSKKGLSANYGYHQNWQDLVIGTDELLELKKIGFFDIASILNQEETSPFEKTILRAFDWIIMAYDHQIDRDLRFLCYINCLETFFSDYTEIRKSLAESTALILGSNYKTRLELYELVSELYNKRSKLVHGGEGNKEKVKEKITDDDVVALQHITCDALYKLLINRDDFNDKEKLKKYIMKYKLSNDSEFLK